jgi:hypothetical protein
MADNVIITPGSGTTIGADEVVDGTLGTVKVQYVKLMDGSLDGTIKGVIGAKGLAVDPRPSQARLSVTPAISTSPVYTSGDILGGLMTLSNAVRSSGGSGIIQSICVQDKNPSLRASIDLVFFDRSITVGADNTVWNVSDADMLNCLGIIPIGAYNTAFPATILNAFSTLINIGLPIVLQGTDLFVVAIIRSAVTYTGTSDLTFILTILQD